jgi:hypothetical protein
MFTEDLGCKVMTNISNLALQVELKNHIFPVYTTKVLAKGMQ